MRSRLASISVRFTLAAILVITADLAVASPTQARVTCDGWMMLMGNAGFESPSDGSPVPQWCTGEGPDIKGVDRGTGWAFRGSNNAYISSVSTGQWNALTQDIVVLPGQTIELSAYVLTHASVTAGYFGVRDRTTGAVYREVAFGPLMEYTRLSVRFPSGGSSNYTAFIGYWSPGGTSWLVVDEVRTDVLPATKSLTSP